MNNKTPQLLKGFRDFGPKELEARNLMMQKIRRVFERYGFAPIETPALEYLETLSGKYGMEEKLMYKFKDQGGRWVALRYDHTVPLARYYALNRNDLPNPFKRYALGQVWRAENTQKGRFREFYQCDVDVVGSDSALADAETIAAVSEAIKELAAGAFSIRLNNRKILDGIFEIFGILPKNFIPVLRLLDKLDKVGEKIVKADLQKLGIRKDQISDLFSLLNNSATDGKELEDNFKDQVVENKKLAEGVGELADVLDSLTSMQMKNFSVDLKLARGLDYYTGTVCEITLSELPNLGSVAGGGRYDNLIGGFLKVKELVPAVGISIGIDRLFTAMQDLDRIDAPANGKVIVLNLDEKLEDRYLAVVQSLRAAGISSDYFYEAVSLDRQFKYAEKKGAGLAIILGSEEAAKGTVKIKDLTTRSQQEVSAEKLIPEVLKRIK